MSPTEVVIVLTLATLPMSGGNSLDRETLIRQAGCATDYIALLTIVESESDHRYVVIVRCRWTPTPISEILREPRETTPRVVGPACPFGRCVAP